MAEEGTLYPPLKSHAVVWEYFGFESKERKRDEVLCRTCRRNVVISGEMSVSNLTAHLRRNHPALFDKLQARSSSRTSPTQRASGEKKIIKSEPAEAGSACPLYPPQTMWSEVWKYFGFKTKELNREEIFCKTCWMKVPAPGSSTSPLRNHLHRKHPALFAKLKKSKTSSRTSPPQRASGEKMIIKSEMSNTSPPQRASRDKMIFKSEMPNTSPAPTASDEKKKISKSQLQTLIQLEVHRQKETKMDCSLKSVQMQLEISSEPVHHRVQMYIKKVQRRAAAAIAYTKKMESNGTQDNTEKTGLLWSPVGPGGEVMDTASHMGRNTMEVNEEMVAIMKVARKTLKQVRADNEDVKAAIDLLTKEPPPPLRHCDSPVSPQHKKVTRNPLKQMRADNEDVKAAIDLLTKEPPPPLRHCDSPVSPQRKRTFRMSNDVQAVQAADHQEEQIEQIYSQDGLSYPSLPAHHFPSILSLEAADYNIPPLLTLQLAIIRNPPGLSVFWNVDEEDPHAPPIDSYTIYITVEKVKGSDDFPKWKSLGEVRPIPLPMCVIITKYKPGYKACLTVVGKDKFGRYGPYSKVVSAIIPD